MSDEIRALDWEWEIEVNPSKLLGYHIGAKILEPLTLNHLETTLEKRLRDVKLHPYSIPVIVDQAIADQAIANTLWYFLQLWPGKMADLEWTDKEI